MSQSSPQATVTSRGPATLVALICTVRRWPREAESGIRLSCQPRSLWAASSRRLQISCAEPARGTAQIWTRTAAAGSARAEGGRAGTSHRKLGPGGRSSFPVRLTGVRARTPVAVHFRRSHEIRRENPASAPCSGFLVPDRRNVGRFSRSSDGDVRCQRPDQACAGIALSPLEDHDTVTARCPTP